MRGNKTTLLIIIAVIVFTAGLFSGACSSKYGSENDLSNILAADLSNHPIYSSYNFGSEENVIDIGIQPEIYWLMINSPSPQF